MNSDEKIWKIAKWRFLQSEPSLWIIGNKWVEITFLVGAVVWIYFEFLSIGTFQYIKYLGLVLVIFSFAAMRGRHANYIGFYDGYEQAFKDACVRNLDYWGGTHTELSDEAAIIGVLSEIEKSEEQISPENREARDKEVKKGFSKLLGYVFTWRKQR
jgi:hypothetical protein